MKIKTFVTGCALALAIFVFAHQRRLEPTPVIFHTIVDLTQAEPDTADRTTGDHPGLASAKSHERQIAGALSSRSKATRIEAPARYARSLWTVDQIPPERLMGQLAVLDVRAKVKRDPGYEITMDDINQWEQVNGQIPLGAVVMAETGWQRRERLGASQIDSKRAPGYSDEAAKFLVEARNVRALGIDTPRVESSSSEDSTVWQYTLSRSVYHLENVVSLERVPASGAVVMVAPMKLEGLADGPVRVLALVK